MYINTYGQSVIDKHERGLPKVTAMELSRMFGGEYGKKMRRRRTAGAAPKSQKAKPTE